MIIMDGITIEEVKSCKVNIDIGTYKDIEALTDKINEIIIKSSGANTTIDDDDADVLKNLADSIDDLLNNVEISD